MTEKYDLSGVFYDMYMRQATGTVRKLQKSVLHALKPQIYVKIYFSRTTGPKNFVDPSK